LLVGRLSEEFPGNYFDFIVNSGPTPFDYSVDGADFTIPSAGYDVWLNGDFLGSWALENPNVTGGVQSFQFNVASGGRIQQYYDNLMVREGAFVIPEPRTAALVGGLAALALALLVRRRGRTNGIA
jgi:hypothetical protein